jgi:hypothetical protein
MKPLRGIGIWRTDQESELPDPRDFIDPTWDELERGAIAEYLEAGFFVRGYLDWEKCLL